MLPVMEISLLVVLSLRSYSLRVLVVTLDSKLTFETKLSEFVSKVARSLGVVCRTGKLFDCIRMVKPCFNVCVLSRLEYCIPMRLSSAEFHLGLLDSVVRSAERLCGVEELCCLGHRLKSVPCVRSTRCITERTLPPPYR